MECGPLPLTEFAAGGTVGSAPIYRGKERPHKCGHHEPTGPLPVCEDACVEEKTPAAVLEPERTHKPALSRVRGALLIALLVLVTLAWFVWFVRPQEVWDWLKAHQA